MVAGHHGFYPLYHWFCRQPGFYDSYLPIIATEDQFDKLSARGYSYGYIGGVILLVIILVMIQNRPCLVLQTLPAIPHRFCAGGTAVGWRLDYFKHLPKDNRSALGRAFEKMAMPKSTKSFREAIARWWSDPRWAFSFQRCKQVVYQYHLREESAWKPANLFLVVLIILHSHSFLCCLRVYPDYWQPPMPLLFR